MDIDKPCISRADISQVESQQSSPTFNMDQQLDQEAQTRNMRSPTVADIQNVSYDNHIKEKHSFSEEG